MRRSILVLMLAAGASQALGQGLEASGELRASSSSVAISKATFKGRAAVQLRDFAPQGPDSRMALLPVEGFRDGWIEADVAGLPQPGASESARGFIGIAFRVQSDPARYEAFYIRPTNGRADDQLRRNHSTQYIGMPDYPWQRLRKEAPGVYESYADMVPGEWTRVRIEVDGVKARLFVGNAEQPVLIVNDLKLGGAAAGGVALWIGNETEGYFSNVRVTRRPD